MAERITPGTFEWDLLYVEHAQRYEHFAPMCQGRHVLDAACGTGFGSRILRRAGAASVCGVDRSEEALEHARRENEGDAAVRFVRADCEALEALEQKFDVVVSFETIEHLRAPERLLAGIREVLHPKGLCVCSTPNILRHSLAPDRAFVNHFHLSEMEYGDFDALFQRYFTPRARFYQNESPGYRRHCDLASILIAQQNSKLLRMEAAVRRLFGKELTRPRCPNGPLLRAIPGDYLIEPLTSPAAWQKTFIFVGEANPR